MNKEEILTLGSFFSKSEKEPLSIFRIEVFVPIFEKKVKIEAFNLPNIDSESAELNLMVNTINEIIDYEKENIKWIKEKIWEHYNICIKNSSYNMVDYSSSNNEVEANQNYFKISTPESSFNESSLNLIHFDVSQIDYPHFNLEFSCPWESEHGMLICIADGEFESID